MRKNKLRQSFLVPCLATACLFWCSLILAQDPPSAQLDEQRVDALLKKVRQEIMPLPLPESPCRLAQFQSQQREFSDRQENLSRWFGEVKLMREVGKEKCAFGLLAELETTAKKSSVYHLQWLYEKTMTLNAFVHTDSAAAEAQRLNELADKYKQFQGWAKYAQARVAIEKRNFEQTQRLAEQALDFARREKDKLLEGKALSLIGTVTRDIYMIVPEKNVPFHERALAIARVLKDTAFMISELTAIGISYDGTPQVDKEFEYAYQAIALLRPNSSLRSRLSSMRLLAIYLHNKQYLDRALPLEMYCIQLSKAVGDKDLTQNMYEGVAGLFFEKKNYDQALAMMDSAATYASFKRELGYFYRGYGDIYEAKGDMPKALEYYKKAFEEQVKGYTDRNAALLTEMETRLRTGETELMLAQQKRQRWLWIGLAAALAGLFGGAVFAFLKQKRGKQKMAEQKQVIEKQADELRRLDEMKSRFFANVSHELRTPLTLMLAPIGSAISRNRLENQDFTLLKVAQTHGKSLLKLVNQILDLSKVHAGKLELQEAPVTLFPFLRRIAATFESHAELQGIRFSFQYKADRGLRLSLDAPKSETILNNLLSNALKFTPPGQSVSVLVEDFDHSLRLVVSDTGRGIHPADLPHVFDRFYQSNQTGAPTEGGTGIGLAFCRELVELMQGKIWVESDLDRGSRFFVEIPKKEILGAELAEEPVDDFIPVENEVVSVITTMLPTDAPKVLVVEDNSSLRDYLRLILSKTCHVETAEHGQAALDALAQNGKFQLIISDIMMPVMDGFQLLKKLKSDDQLRHLPVVMLTARADAQDKLRALRIGVDDYLLKPFEEEELLARVENLLKNHRERQRAAAMNTQLSVSADFGEKISETVSTARGGSQPSTPAVTETENLPAPPAISAEDQAWLEQLENQVKSKLGDTRLTAETLADALAMSRAQFFRQVKKLTGLTPAQYLDEARFRQARSLLELGKARSVKAVAFEVGFRQVEHFSRQFKDRFGKYPSAYLEI